MSGNMDALKSFSRDAILEMWNSGIDSYDIQDLAVKHGLIVPAVATEADAEIYDHVAPGDDFFRFADWMQEQGAEPLVNYQGSDKNANKTNEIPVAPNSQKRCALCHHYDAMQRPGKGFCTVNKEHWPTVDATYCCDAYEARGGGE